jgi:hypothetical protein
MRSLDDIHLLMLADFLPTLSPEEREFVDAYDLYRKGWKERIPAGLVPQAIAFYLQHKATEHWYRQFDTPVPGSEGRRLTKNHTKQR